MPIPVLPDRRLPVLLLCLAWMILVVALQLAIPRQIIPLHVESLQHESDCAYIVSNKGKPFAWPITQFQSDNLQTPNASRLVLLEDGVPMGYPHALHQTIRDQGGNYSHWSRSIYFSTPDCSDPRNNGRQYEASLPVSMAMWSIILWFIAAYFVVTQIAGHYIKKYKSPDNTRIETKINQYFLASIVIIVTAVLLKLPSLVMSAEFYAETGTIFFNAARESSFLGILTYTLADYLVTFQLLVSFVLVRVFGVIDYFPGTVNFIFLLFAAFSVSLINLRAFRVLIESDFLRFVVGLSIGLTPNFELYELLHANLFGFTIFLLFIFVDKNQFNQWLFYILVVSLFLVGIARPNLVAFLPVYGLLLVLAIRQRQLRDIIFYGAGTVSLLLQSYVMIMAQLYWSVRKDSGIYNEISSLASLFTPLPATLNHYFSTMLGVIFKQQPGKFWINLVLILIVSAGILFACHYLYRKKYYLILYFVGLSQVLVLGLIYFIAFSSPVEVDWDSMGFNNSRWWAYSNYIMYISLTVLAYNVLKHVSSRGSVIAMSVCAINFSVYDFYINDDPYGENNSLSNWANYRHLLHEGDYYIPINPVQGLQWNISRDNEKLETEFKTDDEVSGVRFSGDDSTFQFRSMIIVNHNYQNSMNDLIIKAYDQGGNEIAIPRRLNDFQHRYLYYYFTERTRPHELMFFNEKMQSVGIKPDLHLYGKQQIGERILITDITGIHQ